MYPELTGDLIGYYNGYIYGMVAFSTGNQHCSLLTEILVSLSNEESTHFTAGALAHAQLS
jgi:hypothetical protein